MFHVREYSHFKPPRVKGNVRPFAHFRRGAGQFQSVADKSPKRVFSWTKIFAG
jgi:hypothetical protein